jgi:hypothetical protein
MKRTKGKETLIRNVGGKPVFETPGQEGNVKPAAQTIKTNSYVQDSIDSYNPDAKYELSRISYPDFAKRFSIPRTVDGKQTRITASLVVQNEGGLRETIKQLLSGKPAPDMKVVNVAGWPALDAVRKSESYKGQKFAEAYGVRLSGRALKEAAMTEDEIDYFQNGSDQSTGGGALGANDEYHPLMMGPYNRQLYMFDFLDQASKAYWEYHHNPVLKAAINAIVGFTLADGVKVTLNNQGLQDAWDKWTESVGVSGVTYQDKLRMMYRDACVIGESFIWDPGGKFGPPEFKLWDATTVWEVVTDPRDIEKVYYAYRQFPTQYQLPLSADSKQKMPSMMEYVVEQVPPEQWLQVRVNNTAGEKRGRSDLLAVLGYAKRFRDWLNAAVINAQIRNAFVVWWNVNGSPADVQALRENVEFSTVPPPGSSWFTNNAVVPSLIQNEGGGVQAQDKTGETLLAVIATSLNLPPEYLGVSGTGTRATALVRGEPAAKFFEQRQQMIREVVSWQVKRLIVYLKATHAVSLFQPKKATVSAIMCAVVAGRFGDAIALIGIIATGGQYQEKLDERFEVVMPQIEPANKTEEIKNWLTCLAAGIYSLRTVGSRIAALMDDHQFDFDTEQAQILSEEEQGIRRLESVPSDMGTQDETNMDSSRPDGTDRADNKYRDNAGRK